MNMEQFAELGKYAIEIAKTYHNDFKEMICAADEIFNFLVKGL